MIPFDCGYVHFDQHGIQKGGWFSNTSFTTGLKTLPTFRPDALVFFRAKMGEGFQPCCEAGIGEPTLSDYVSRLPTLR